MYGTILENFRTWVTAYVIEAGLRFGQTPKISASGLIWFGTRLKSRLF